MLYARINKEYINQDELAKKIVFERTISQVNKLYGDQKEVALKPGQLSSQLKYGFDSLFEGFRSAIEQVLAADYNGDITTQKTYEIIKKYNQLSSYLKNVVNMKQLSPDDEETIKKSFNELREKLELLKQIAIDNNFLDKQDIIEMVDKINETSTTKQQQLEKIPGTTISMVKAIQDKNEALKKIQDAVDKLQIIEQDLQDANIANSTKLKSQADEYQQLFDFFDDPNLNPLEFELIEQNYEAVENLESDVKNDIAWFIDTKQKIDVIYQELDNYEKKKDLPNITDALIEKLIREKTDEEVQERIDALNATFDALTDAEKQDPANIGQLKKDSDDVKIYWNDEVKNNFLPNTLKDLAQWKTAIFLKFRGDLDQKTLNQQGFLINNDTLDENALSKKENDLNNIKTDLITNETTWLNNMINGISKNIKKITKGVKKQPKKVNIKIVPPKTSIAPQPLKSGVVINPVYKDYQSFKNAYIKAYNDTVSKKRNPPFKGTAKTEKGYKGEWTRYLLKGDLAKQNYFA